MEMNEILCGDSTVVIKSMEENSIHLILSDIPYGIAYDDWDVLHNNTNKGLLGVSPAQQKSNGLFKHRGKPLNGWALADRSIPKEYYEWCLKWGNDWLRVLKPGGSAIIFAGRRLAHRCICAMEDVGFLFKDMIGMEKEHAPHRAQRISVVYERRGDLANSQYWEGWRLGNLRPLFEPILWFMKPYKIGGTISSNVLEYGVGAFNDLAWRKYNEASANMVKFKASHDDCGLHPAQKPLLLLEALIELTTKEGQIVFDPFCGSGSTLVAAKLLGRQFLGIENNEHYVKIAKERLEKLNLKSESLSTADE
ncbi:MAG: site-specific DNA-methyltransferase [Desulfovibrionaceae bacterium]|nr:site-specific DNA-methyltransferase [Desulfovibrionaceae bacterium]